MHSPNNQGQHRFAELDGLRALAVLAVILFHCNISGLADAGFFGVDMFFMISGFIITAMLAREYRDHQRIGLGAFYFRRLKRLLPPVLALLLLATATIAISASAYAAFTADVPAALAYTSNLRQIMEQQSYFDKTPHVLKHLWSLAVEEQFYLLWPPMALLFLRRYGPQRTGLLALLLAGASTAWMAILYDPSLDTASLNRIYLGTDTHAMGLLAGAALACFWNPWATRPHEAGTRWRWRLAASASLIGLVYLIQRLNPADPLLYQGGFLLVPALTAMLAYGTMNDRDFIVSRCLRSGLAQWLGSRSYSLYLVHWLVFTWLQLGGYDDFSQPLVLAAALISVALLSEALYRLVELPSKHFAPASLRPGQMMRAVLAYTVTAWVIFAVTVKLHHADLPASPAVAAHNDTPATAPPDEAAAVAPPPDASVPATQVMGGGGDIYAIGDSVLLGAKSHLTKTLPGIRVDAEVGRQASQGLKVLQQWRSQSGHASTVLVHLGTNGYINEAQFRALLAELADRKQVLVINVHANRRWTAPNNELIRRLPADFPNLRVIDWNAVAADHPDYFVKDGIHLTSKGLQVLTLQILQATGATVLLPGKDDTMLGNDDRARHQRAPVPVPTAVSVPAAVPVAVPAAIAAAVPEPPAPEPAPSTGGNDAAGTAPPPAPETTQSKQ
ncbi:MAG: acyltransferase family protein [Sphingomonadaceae bacterium]